jgi:hypothetical protein
VRGVDGVDSRWRAMYRLGSICGLTIVGLIPLQMAVFFLTPPPGFVPNAANAADWFHLFESSTLLGLVHLDLLLAIDFLLGGLLILALCIALRRAHATLTLVAAALAMIGVAAALAANPALSMLSLSQQYHAATTDAERSLLLAAAQSLLAMYQGTAFMGSFVLLLVSPLLVSIAMLRSRTFTRTTAWLGIGAAIVGLVMGPPWQYIDPRAGAILSFASVVGFAVWYVLVARTLMQLVNRAGQLTLEPMLMEREYADSLPLACL